MRRRIWKMEKKVGEMKVDVEWKDENGKEWKMKKKKIYFRIKMMEV